VEELLGPDGQRDPEAEHHEAEVEHPPEAAAETEVERDEQHAGED